MSVLVALAAQLVHIGLMLVGAPLVAGVTDWLEARLAGRPGPPVLLPWHEILRLSRKTAALPESASPALSSAPVISLGAIVTAAVLIPSFSVGMILAPLADGLAIAALLSLAHAARCLGTLDTGSAASGLTGQQASAFAVAAEPTLLLFLFTLGLMGGGFNVDTIIAQQQEGMLLPAGASALAMTSLLAVVFAEAGTDRSGYDLDVGGVELAVYRYTIWLRRIVWIDLIGCLFLPVGMAGPQSGLLDWGIAVICWAVKLVAAVLCLAAIGTLFGWVARRKMPNLLGSAALLAVLAVIVTLASTRTP